jgi:hypothetical protein
LAPQVTSIQKAALENGMKAFRCSNNLPHNNAINTDSEKRRAFVAPLFTAGYGER